MSNLTVNQVAKLAGVTIRALHYYDEIGLLRPSDTTQSGYRLYDDTDLVTLQQILFFKELDFSLSDIKRILTSDNYNKTSALENQKKLLVKKRERLDKIIELVEKSIKGDNDMSFKQFDATDIENAKKQYAEEVKQRWGDSDAYKESQRKTDSYGEKEWQAVTEKSNAIFDKFSNHVGESPASEEVQKLVAEWQNHISESFYKCTKEILMGLGEMYVTDERFTNNIDSFGKGTARLMSEAIAIYTKH